MKFFDTVKNFWKSPKADPAAVAAREAFNASIHTCDAAFLAIETYTTRANHRLAIHAAASRLHEAPPDDSLAADAYDKAVAAYTDPADFASYTEADLDAHTAAMENLSAAFDNQTAAFAALIAAFKPTEDLYALAAALYKASSDYYMFAVTAYGNAVCCAKITASGGNLQAAKDKWRLMLLEDRSTYATNSVVANAKSAAFKAKCAEDASKAKILEQKSAAAEGNAELFHAKAKSAEIKANEALATSQNYAAKKMARIEANDDSSFEHYRGIVAAFSEKLAANTPLIGDCSMLPYPKRTILYAIRWVIEELHDAEEIAESRTSREKFDEMILSLNYLLTRLARDWQTIDSADKPDIAKLGDFKEFPDWALPLKFKYINDEKASEEAAEVAFQVMRDRIVAKKVKCSS